MRRAIALGLLFFVLLTLASGCLGIGEKSDIESKDDAVDKISEVSDDVEDLSTELDDVNSELG